MNEQPRARDNEDNQCTDAKFFQQSRTIPRLKTEGSNLPLVLTFTFTCAGTKTSYFDSC